MTARAIPALAACAAILGAGAPLAAAEPEVAVFHVADEGSLRVWGARAARGTGASATVVVVVETARGDRLVLRRAPAGGGGLQFALSSGGSSGVTFTRRGAGYRLEAGGRSLEVLEGDLARPTVRCWVSALAARVDPKLLEAAAAVRLLKEQTGGPPLEDVFTPLVLLWQVADPSDLRPRGAVRLEKGPFAGEEAARIARAAADELGKP